MQKFRERSLAFLDSMSLNLESNDSHELIERNIREQINNLSDNVANMEKMSASMDTVSLPVFHL